ncbi:MAG: PorT family protein [Cytophagales bacterium]|nr:PorT family protein [Cytophagales bacterium]
MKRFHQWFVVVMLLYVCHAAGAQSLAFEPEFNWGIKGGMNFSRVNFVPSISQRLLQGGQMGLVVSYLSEPNLGFRAELNYAQKGWDERIRLGGGDSIAGYSRRMDYLELPFVTLLRLGLSKRVFLPCMAGSMVAFCFMKSKARTIILYITVATTTIAP